MAGADLMQHARVLRRDEDTDAPRDNRVRTQGGKDGHLQAKDRDLRRSQPCRHFDLRLLVSRIMRK